MSSYRDAIDVILARIPEAVTDFNGSTAVPGEGWLAGHMLDNGEFDYPPRFEKTLFTSLFDYYFNQLQASDLAEILRIMGSSSVSSWWWQHNFVEILKSLPGGIEFQPVYMSVLPSDPISDHEVWAHNLDFRQRISSSHTAVVNFTGYPYLVLDPKKSKAASIHLKKFCEDEKSLGFRIKDEQNSVEFFFEDEVTGMLFTVKYGDRIIL